MGKTVMIVGLGDLGGWVLEFLARCEGVKRIVTTDIRKEYGGSKTESAAIGCSQQGFNKRLEFHELDLFDIDRTADLLRKVQPDVTYSAVTLQSWWAPLLLPHDITDIIEEAGIGTLVPNHLVLAAKLMQAVKRSGVQTKVIQNSFPDLVNPILWRNDLGADMGSGNSDQLMELIRKNISYEYDVPPQEVAVYLYTGHAMTTRAVQHNIPFILKIYVAGQEVTSKYDTRELVKDLQKMYAPIKMTTWLDHPRVAASAVKHIMAVINDTHELTSLPGPNGLPGGYSVRVSAKGAEVVLPEGITMEEVIRVNQEALMFDGVEEIKENGTVVFTEYAKQKTKEWLGTTETVEDLKLEDAEERAKLIISLVKKVADKYNVKLEL